MSETDAIISIFKKLGGEMLDPDILLPSALPLDLCGESVRARLCMFNDHNNRSMALRPDLTLPVALLEVEARKTGQTRGERVHRYAARAFRQPVVAEGKMEFVQIGFERFGAPVSPELDAETYALVSEAAERAGVLRGVARFGDLGILPAFIKALGLSEAVSAGLQRAFRQAGGVRAFLERLSVPQDAFIVSLAGLDQIAVAGKLVEALECEGVTHFGNRTQAEIIERLMDQARHVQDDAVPAIAQTVLEAVLALKCPPAEAAKHLRTIAGTAGIAELEETISALEARLDLIVRESPRFLSGTVFSPAFGRRFTYYDGFVFEIAEPGERIDRPFGTGGRYDHLLSDLSLGCVSATAIGGVVRPDRLALAAGKGDAA